MCCSSGVCGPSVDPKLPRFASDLEWLKAQGVSVERYNLAQEPAAFVSHQDVRDTLQAEQTACLPIIRVNGVIVSRGSYPTRAELARWAGVTLTSSLSLVEGCCGGRTNCC
jgi:hypothetical protein